jgi:hypothetical protein
VTEGELCREDGSIAVIVDAGDIVESNHPVQTASYSGNKQSKSKSLYYNSILSDLVPVEQASGDRVSWQQDMPQNLVHYAMLAIEADRVVNNNPVGAVDITAIDKPVIVAVVSEALPEILSQPAEVITEPQFTKLSPVELKPANLHGNYLVIGSFGRWSNASRFAERHGILGTQLVSAIVNDRQVYRILVGPYVADTRRELVASVKGAGIRDIWAIKVAENTVAIDPKQDRKVQLVFLPQ